MIKFIKSGYTYDQDFLLRDALEREIVALRIFWGNTKCYHNYRKIYLKHRRISVSTSSVVSIRNRMYHSQ